MITLNGFEIERGSVTSLNVKNTIKSLTLMKTFDKNEKFSKASKIFDQLNGFRQSDFRRCDFGCSE